MIFLAVTMGFLAESLREHFVEKKHGREYMVSLVRDLGKDITDSKAVLSDLKNKIANADSLTGLFKNADYKNSSGDMYYFGRRLWFRSLWRSNDGTIQQLNYAGGLRLIENKIIVDSIYNYIGLIKDLSQILSLEDLEITEYRKALSSIFDGFVFDEMIATDEGNRTKKINYNPDLISTDKKDINNLTMQFVIVKTNRLAQSVLLNAIVVKANALINLIKKEYNLE